jgi:indole-3-glycerol phosphate synthase
MFLEEIIKEKKSEVEAGKSKLPLSEILCGLEKPRDMRDFKAALNKPHTFSLIAEIKRSSPSRGLLRKKLDVPGIASVYEVTGAAAISVLTDEKFFGGRLSFIKEAKNVTSIPVLRKDFIIDEYQIYESAYYGADAFLLIAAILSEQELRNFLRLGEKLNMDAIAEVHTEEDLEKALAADAGIIGINNRDLHTFEVELETTSRLIRLVPEGKLTIAESGVKSYEDLMTLKSFGVNAVLIGEAFMESPDIAVRIKEIMGW